MHVHFDDAGVGSHFENVQTRIARRGVAFDDHGQIELRGGVFYLADESPESDVAAPDPGEAARVSLTAEVVDVDATADGALLRAE